MKNNKGFSLIEALIATAVLAFLVLSILSGFSSQIYSNKKNRGKTMAVTLAEERVEQLIKYNAEQIATLGLVGTDTVDTFENAVFVKGHPEYLQFRRTTNIVQDPTNAEMVNIRVTVEYGKKGNRYPFRIVLRTRRG